MRVIGRSLSHLLLVLLGVSVLVFMILHLSPGDPARLMLPDGASDQQVAELRESLGLNRPLPVQYGRFMAGLAQGDLGRSLRFKEPNQAIITRYLPHTLMLSAAALGVAVIVGIPLGVAAAVRRGSGWDLISMILALLGQSMSPIWLGPLLIFAFVMHWEWFPAPGSVTAASLILPAITLGAPLIAMITRMTRAGVLETLQEDFIRTARAKGVSGRLVIFKHALRPALIPIVTVIALQLGTLLGGAVVTEAIFMWPGVGSLAVEAIRGRDFPLIQAVTLIVSTLFVIINLLVDLSYLWLDPRVRYS